MHPGEKRHCLQCEKPLSGRTDKKFCDAYCRNSHNNRSKRAEEECIHTLNSQLRRNRRILKTLCPTGKATVRKAVLTEMGFDFGLFTSIFPSGGNVYYFSHEYGYTPLTKHSLTDHTLIRKVLIIQRQAFMAKPYDPWKFLKS